MIFITPKGEDVEINDARYEEAISKGYKPAMEMVHPETMENVVIPKHRVKEAISKGYKSRIEAEAASEAQSRFIEAGKDIDPLTAGISGVVSALPGSNFIPGQEALSEQAWENQPVAYGVGKTAGIAGSMALPSTLAANIGMGALEGAANDENMVRGAITGGTVGSLLHGAGTGIGKLAQKAAPKYATKAEQAAFETLQYSPQKAARFESEGKDLKLGRELLDQDLLSLNKGKRAESSQLAKERSWEPIGDIYSQVKSDVTYSDLQKAIKQKASPLLNNESTYKLGQAMNAYADDLEQFKKIHPDVDIANLDEGFKLWAKENNLKLNKLSAAADIKTGIEEKVGKKVSSTEKEIGNIEDYATDIDREIFNRGQTIEGVTKNIDERVKGNLDLQKQIPKGLEPELRNIENEVNSYLYALKKEKNPARQKVMYRKLITLQKQKEKMLNEYNRAMKIAYNKPQMFEEIKRQVDDAAAGLDYKQKTKKELYDAINPLKETVSEGKEVINKLGTDSVLNKLAKETGKTKQQLKNYLETRGNLVKKSAETTGDYKQGEKIIPLENLKQTKTGLQKAFDFSGLEAPARGQLSREISSVYRSQIGDSIERSLGQEARQGFDALNEKYGLLAEIAKKQNINKYKKSATYTPSDLVAGAAGALGGGIAGGALGGSLGAAGAYAIKKFIRDYGDVLKAKGYNIASKKLEYLANNQQNMLQYISKYPTLDLLINALENSSEGEE